MPRRSAIDAQLQALYDQVPSIPDCDGSCWISCGPLEMSDRERQRLRDAGYKITPAEQARMQGGTYWCEALKDRRCAVYELRPMVCRWWGTTEDMKCPRGCVPDGGFLTDEQGWHLLAEADRVGGHGLPRERIVAQLPPAARANMQRVMAAGRGGVGLRARHNLPPGFRPELSEAPCPACGFLLAIPDGPPAGGVCGNCGARLKGEWRDQASGPDRAR